MAVLSRTQRPAETIDEYITNARSKMVDYNYDNDLQMTLLINGLQPEIKSLVMQHLPFDGLDEFVTKARHAESALRTQNSLNLPGYSVNLMSSNTCVPDKDDLQRQQITALKVSMQDLSDKFDSLHKQLAEKMRPYVPNQRSNWTRDPAKSAPWQQTKQQTFAGSQKLTQCWNCGRTGHIQKNCRMQKFVR